MVDDIIVSHSVVGDVYSLNGGKPYTNRVSYLRLKLGITVESHFICESHNCGLRYSDLAAHCARCHVCRLVVVVYDELGYLFLPLGQLRHSLFYICDKIISHSIHCIFPRTIKSYYYTSFLPKKQYLFCTCALGCVEFAFFRCYFFRQIFYIRGVYAIIKISQHYDHEEKLHSRKNTK
jgi:hypothetical protein